MPRKPGKIESAAPLSVATTPSSSGDDCRPDSPFVPSEMSEYASDFEFASMTLMFGFQSWIENCMDAADFRGLSSLDVLVLHTVNHRARRRRQADICMVLNIEDPHLVAYALKKLQAANLVEPTVDGRERLYQTTERGEAACLAYLRVREEFLIPSLSWIEGGEKRFKDVAGFMRAMTALYAQAGRFAIAATAGLPRSPKLHTKR
jgi:predicted MarR family transcription regulator